MQKLAKMFCKDLLVYCFTSSKIPTRAPFILAMTVMVVIPHYNFLCNDIGDEVDGRIAVATQKRYFIIRIVVPRHMLISPNAVASFSLSWQRICYFCTSSTSCSTNLVSDTYLSAAISLDMSNIS
jgi:hypothetical protein